MKGRPTKLTPQVQQKICVAISSGNYYEAACSYAGVTYKVFRDWMKRGAKAKRGIYREFRNAVKKAEADAEVRIVAQWQRHMPENWQACRDFLARRYPKRWGPKDEVTLAGKKGEPLEVVITETEYVLTTERDEPADPDGQTQEQAGN